VGAARTAARAMVRVATAAAPADVRADLRAEWQAEIDWWSAHPPPGTAAGRDRRLIRRSLGIIVHVFWLRTQQWSVAMLAQDLRFALRVLAGTPSFALTAILTLALGIGANAAIFSVVYGVLLKPLPFREPDRLVQLWETNPLNNWTDATASPANLLDWKRRNQVFEDIAVYPGMDDKTPMYSNGTVTLLNAEPERLRAVLVSTNMFQVLGVSAAIGRAFDATDEKQSGGRVALLSHAAWSSQFRADPGIVGRDIAWNSRTYRVIGVMPAAFRFPAPDIDVYLPFVMVPAMEQMRRPHYLRPVARLKPGVTLAAARADLQRVAAELEREYPDTNTRMSAGLGPLHDWVVGGVRRSLFVFLGAVSLVLLIACANLANLLLARASGRARELAIRSALGGARWRLIRQLLTESAVLAAAGGLLGLFFARWTLQALLALSPPGIPRLDDVALDGPALAFIAALATVTTLLFGAVPAWQGASIDPAALRDGVRTTGGRLRTRRALVIAQVAASVALLIGAGLFLRSFARLQAVPPGFTADNVVTWKLTLPGAVYETDGKRVAYYEGLLTRLRGIPGVAAAGGSTVLGLEGQGWTGELFIDGRPEVHGRGLLHKDVTEGYFAAVGLPIVRGRDFAATDHATAPPVIVVNESFVRAYFRDDDPVGRRISFSTGRERVWETIVGVVRDEKQNTLAEPVKPEVYGTHRQKPTLRLALAVRGSVSPAALMPAVRAAVRQQDPGIAMYDVRTLGDVVMRSVARERFTAWVVGVFAALASAIAAIGVYGVVGGSVTRRTREIGLRVALGATRREIAALVFAETLAVVAVGLALGVLLAVAGGGMLRPLLFDVQPVDATTYAAVTGLIAAVAVLASCVPLRRALSVDPVTALRTE
jgi:putative ABC transport system permease protein